MTDEDNGYGNILEIMYNQSPEVEATYVIGTVVQSVPLVVKIGKDLQISQENMKVNAFLLAGYGMQMGMATAAASGSTGASSGGSGDSSYASHGHPHGSIGIPSAAFTKQNTLAVGDEVVMLKSKDGQQYIVLCKVV